MRVSDLAEFLGCPYEGDGDYEVVAVADLSDGGPESLGFLRSRTHLPQLATSKLGAVIALPGTDVGSRPVIRSPNPGLHFARAVALLCPVERPAPGVHPAAHVDPDAVVDPAASVGAHCTIGARCWIGAGTVLHPHVTLYPDVRVGSECTLHSRVVLRERTRVGDRVVLQPGVVLGADGFGYAFDEQGGWEHIPHTGGVVVEDDVEIGANSTIDRSLLGETRIGRGTKIDNLVMVGHNCEIGEDVLVAAQVGMAGSSTVKRRVIMMGQTGLAGHLTLGEGAFVGARAGVRSDVPPGTRVWGTPQLEERRWLRSSAVFAKLPELVKRVRAIERQLGLRGGPKSKPRDP
jgi:UDP-3-O-[3-hydroxymyristoyl] glucosamine N-acyltransferase